MCQGEQCPGAGVPSMFMSEWGAVLAASVLCVTLPSRGPVLSVPREPQPKLQGDGGEGGCTALAERADCFVSGLRSPVSGWVLPRDLGGQCCFPSPLPLQAAFLLPQCLMPGHTATEYAIRVGDMPHAHTPTPGSPWTPKAAAAMASF